MIALALIVLLLVALAAHLTQPVWFSGDIDHVTATVDPARLEAHVRSLSERLVPRDAAHPEDLDRVAAYVRGELERAGGVVADQPFDVHGITYRNVLARFGPDTAERIVVGAHYDTDGPFPGTDDNASGVAALIELAYLLGRTPPPLTVELVAYTLEEMPYFRTPYMGSAVHAASLKARGIAVRLMISLEMLGFYSAAPGSQRYPLPVLRLFYPAQGDFIAVVGKLDQPAAVRRVKKAMQAAASLPVYSINAPRSLPGVEVFIRVLPDAVHLSLDSLAGARSARGRSAPRRRRP